MNGTKAPQQNGAVRSHHKTVNHDAPNGVTACGCVLWVCAAAGSEQKSGKRTRYATEAALHDPTPTKEGGSGVIDLTASVRKMHVAEEKVASHR